MTKNILIGCVVTLCILVLGFFVLNEYIYSEKQATDQPVEPYRATLQGEYLCLPHIDTSGAQTDECTHGIKTDVGEYYAINFALMSQTHDPLQIGERISAAGVVTPVTEELQKYPISGIFAVTDSLVTGPYECDGDARLCPDGSSVGRSGPNCDFTPCLSPDATSAQVTTYLGGTATALTVSVSPVKIVSDSRCPATVTCIWEGTVEVQAVLATPVSHGEHTLVLGTPQTFGEYTVTLIGVTPEKTESAIPDSSYRFTFEILQ